MRVFSAYRGVLAIREARALIGARAASQTGDWRHGWPSSSASPVTAGVPQLVLEQLASASQLHPLPRGVDVVVQGDPADAFYAAVSGRVLVHRDGVVRVHLGPGDSFGERGLLDKAPRNATVTTEMETVVLRVEGDVLLESLDVAPMLTTALDRSSTAPGVTVPPDEPPLMLRSP